jgi:8-hydroxy-5-deazaflavin:NADPH oxidoreductase
MKIGIIGSGTVAQTLAAGFLEDKHDVMLGTGSPQKLDAFRAKHAGAKVGSFDETASFGELVVLAVKGDAAEKIVAGVATKIANKPVADTTNPLDGKPPVDGVLSYFTGPNDSLLERLKRVAPEAQWVKCWSSVGAPGMVRPKLAGGPPTMFICGDDKAKAVVKPLLEAFGWSSADMGPIIAARAIEPLCILWCIPGFRENSWSHAFHLLKPA